MSAVEACSTNAFAFAVENIAVPWCSVPAGVPFASDTVAALAADSINLAAPARICNVPVCSVLSLSPLNTVAPVVAKADPTWAPKADVMVPTAGEDAPIAVETTNKTESTTQKKARKRAIRPPFGPKKEYSLAVATSMSKRIC
jgi:hypothetical protein